MTYNFSHSLNNYSNEKINEFLVNLKEQIQANNNKFISGYTSNELLELADELKNFDLGRFLIINRGLDGYWTDYVLNYSRNNITNLTKLEQALFNSRIFKATYQRHQIFKRENQIMLLNGKHLASIPSGLMSELLDLDYSKVDYINLSAIDIDAQAFNYLKQKYKNFDTKVKVETICIDALSFVREEAFDLISSNGLTIYMKNDNELQHLFNNFFVSLKPGGKLVTSFLTCPSGENSEHKAIEANEFDKLATAVFADILQVKWNCYRTTVQMKKLLENSGFTNIEVYGDDNYIFPTITAFKKKI